MQQCILSYNNREEVLELPVPLQEWAKGDGANTYTFSTIETGDVLAIGAKKLSQLSIDSFFPANTDYSFLLNTDFPDPWTCVEMVKRWQTSKRPIRVVIVDTDVNEAMAIENFDYGKSDNSDDVYFTLDLIEYTFLNTERSKRADKDDELKERQEEKEEDASSKTHKVKRGDTMWDMSEKYLGDGGRWKEIAELNDMKDGWDLRVGETIKIPPKEKQTKVKEKATPVEG